MLCFPMKDAQWLLDREISMDISQTSLDLRRLLMQAKAWRKEEGDGEKRDSMPMRKSGGFSSVSGNMPSVLDFVLPVFIAWGY